MARWTAVIAAAAVAATVSGNPLPGRGGGVVEFVLNLLHGIASGHNEARQNERIRFVSTVPKFLPRLIAQDLIPRSTLRVGPVKVFRGA